jgi:hypothetical protein
MTAGARGLTAAVAAACVALAPLRAQDLDSLEATAHRVAAAWRTHDFGALVGGGGTLVLQLAGETPSGPLRPAQAAGLLAAFARGAEEVAVQVRVVRELDSGRGYVEIQRTFARGAGTPAQVQMIYVGLVRAGTGYVVSEIRVVP